MRVKDGDDMKETAVEEGDGTVERSVFEEASDMPRGAKGSGNGKGKFSRGKWVNQQNIVKLLVSLVGLGGGIYFSYREFLREDVTATIRKTAKGITNSHGKHLPRLPLPSQERCCGTHTSNDKQLVWSLPANNCCVWPSWLWEINSSANCH